MSDDAALKALVSQVVANRRYQTIDRDLVGRVAADMLSRYGPKLALKATRNKLHQIGAVYFDAIDYNVALARLHASADDMASFRLAAENVMRRHASTRERLPLLDEFYGMVFAEVSHPVNTVLDLACGLNPLALPWMPIEASVDYVAVDIFHDLANFLTRYFALMGQQGRAMTADILTEMPDVTADVAFLLKSLPCLAQLEKDSALPLLDAIPARTVVVSFPTASLGGRERGMAVTYRQQAEALLAQRDWAYGRLELPGELVYIVRKVA